MYVCVCVCECKRIKCCTVLYSYLPLHSFLACLHFPHLLMQLIRLLHMHPQLLCHSPVLLQDALHTRVQLLINVFIGRALQVIKTELVLALQAGVLLNELALQLSGLDAVSSAPILFTNLVDGMTMTRITINMIRMITRELMYVSMCIH